MISNKLGCYFYYGDRSANERCTCGADEHREREKELQRMANYAATAKRIEEAKRGNVMVLSERVLRQWGTVREIEVFTVDLSQLPLAGREEDDSE